MAQSTTPQTPAGRPVSSVWQEPCFSRLLDLQARRFADNTALAAPGRAPLTYARLRDCVHDVARALWAHRLGRGDRIALALPDGPEMALAFVAVAACATAAPLNPGSRAEEFDFYLADLDASALILPAGAASPAAAAARARGIPVLEMAPVPGAQAGVFTLRGPACHGPAPKLPDHDFARPEDVALVLYTSGTTSRPKCVPLTHRNLAASARNIGQALGLTPADRCIDVMPLFHLHGLNTLYASLFAGASVLCPPGFAAGAFFSWLEAFGPTWYTAAPAFHQAILKEAPHQRDVLGRCAPLRLIRSSSAPLAPQTLAELESLFGAPVIEYYGMTETSALITSNLPPPGVRKPGSVGTALGQEVAVWDERGAPLGPGQPGQIVVRGANVVAGYANNPAANEEAFRDGWFCTGDVGYFDADGYLFLTGRTKEIINRGGEKIAPREVEEALLAHPAVAEAAAFALPHAQLGEEVAAAVVLRPGARAEERELRDFAAARLAPFKVPRRIVLGEELPKTATGKLQRVGLAERLGLAAPANGAGVTPRGSALVAPRTPTEAALCEIWCELLERDGVGVDDSFFDLGGHSLLAASLMARIERAWGRSLPLETLLTKATIADLAQVLTQDEEGDSLYPLVPVHAGGSRRPFVFLDGDIVHGIATYCLEITRCLGADQPFYLLRPHGLDGRPLPATVEAMAADHVRTLRRFQPEGPYRLGGYCNGAVVAYEMARQLQAQGQTVDVLALVEPRVRDVSFPLLDRAVCGLGALARLDRDEQTRWLWRLRYCADRWHAFRRQWVGQQALVVARKLAQALGARRNRQALYYQMEGLFETQVASFDAEAYLTIIRSYRARRHGPYNDRIDLFWSKETLAAAAKDPTKGWRKVAREVAVRPIAGNHFNCIMEHVPDLAQHLRVCLLQAQTAAPARPTADAPGPGCHDAPLAV